MSSSDSVIFLTDASTYSSLRQALLARDDIQEPQLSKGSRSDKKSETKISTDARNATEEILTYKIDNKYYTADISLYLCCVTGPSFTFPSSQSSSSSSLTASGNLAATEPLAFGSLCSPEGGEGAAQAFVWAFSDESVVAKGSGSNDLPKPPPEYLQTILEHQSARELNYALYLSKRGGDGAETTAGAESGAVAGVKVGRWSEEDIRIRVSEEFDEFGWESVHHSLNEGDATTARGEEGGVPRDLDEEDLQEEDGLKVIFESLQTIMWEGMKRKPKSVTSKPKLNREVDREDVERHIVPLVPGTIPDLNSNLQSSLGRGLGAVEKEGVIRRDLADSKRMEDDLEAWLNDEPGAISPTPASLPASADKAGGKDDTTASIGFEDDFGPFLSSSSSDALNSDARVEDSDLDLDLDLEQEVNLEAILDQLNRTRAELGMVENEDERRVRAGKEVGRLLGMMGLDLDDDDDDDDDGGRDEMKQRD